MPINTGVAKGADFCAKVMEYFQKLHEYFQKVVHYLKFLIAIFETYYIL